VSQAAVLLRSRTTPEERRAILSQLSDWHDLARDEQQPPTDQWRTWYVRGGRGSGKTWTGANALAEMALRTPGDYGVVAPTFADMRDKCVEGPSGLLKALGTGKAEVRRGAARRVEAWNRSLGELRLRNGSVIHGDGADDGAPTIQGYNLRGCWADEVGLWKSWKMAWEESIRFAVRLYPARIVATGTPKRGHPLVKSLMADATVHKTLLLTLDNAANLDPALLDELISKYAGTTIGRQELEGEILDDVPGALWRRGIIRMRPAPTKLVEGKPVIDYARIVVAIDPAVTAGEDSDETGIVVNGLGHDGMGYTISDLSRRALPAEWARTAVDAYHAHEADLIVGEANNGGEMVREVIRAVDPRVPVKLVHASRGKTTRAQPIATVYEQGRWFHVEPMPELEDQMCSYTGAPNEASPDRMDAHVWGASELLGLSGSGTWGGGQAWGT
jgi:predicted phage terminase large subunit-like protein